MKDHKDHEEPERIVKDRKVKRVSQWEREGRGGTGFFIPRLLKTINEQKYSKQNATDQQQSQQQ